MSGRFQKGTSGNPAGRPKARRPHVSAFDVIIDKTLTVTQNGIERELTIDEALELQTYQAALKGSKMAVRAVLKMIEKREVALAKAAPPPQHKPPALRWERDPRNADEAMLLLGITVRDPGWTEKCEYGVRMKMATWATQAGISRAGRRKQSERELDNIRREALEPEKLRWPRGPRSG
jgi:hypothetical protein